MAESPGGLPDIDKVIHEPARLTVATALLAADGADFRFLQTLTGLTKGNLSSHLHKLQDAGIIALIRSGAGRTARTWIELTPDGRTAVARHWEQLDRLRGLAQGGL